jgi:hypothetical protein
MTRLSILASGALLVMAGACGSSSPANDAGELLSCYDASGVAITRLVGEATDLAACSVDADCTATPIRLTCVDQDVVIEGCPVALAVDSTSAFADRTAAVAAELCGTFEPGCRSSVCQAVESRCVSGTCELIPVAP